MAKIVIRGGQQILGTLVDGTSDPVLTIDGTTKDVGSTPTPTGPAGADGKTILSGTGAPSIALGVNGDFYINTTVWTIYGPKASNIWPAPVSIIGPTGATGSNGSNGTNGNGILNGVVAPTTEGVNGDFYIDIASFLLYGPKSGGAWGSGVSLVGPQGVDGDPGSNGSNGSNGTSSFTYIGYAEDADGNGYETTPGSNRTYIAFFNSSVSFSPTASDFTGLWQAYRGDGDRWTTTSTTSLTIGTGAQSLTVETLLAYAVGQYVVVSSVASSANRMEGYVTSYDPSSGVLVLNITVIAGSGTLSLWAVSIQGVPGVQGYIGFSNIDVDTGTETVDEFDITLTDGVRWDYVVKKTTNVVAGSIIACHDGTTNVEFSNISTTVLGTVDVIFTVDISGGNIRLRATASSDNWSIKGRRYYIIA
jgi:hypothetical protein